MLVLKINYTKHPDRAGKSVRYHGFRTREMAHDMKGMFSKDRDNADIGAFIRSIDDPLTRPRQTRRGEIEYAVMHRLMFSLSRKEFEACGFTSWKPVIREALAAVERYHGMELEWIAAEHQSREHPHVHVDIKSVYTDADGNRRRLNIGQELRQHIRWAVEGIMKRERERVWADRRQLRAMERSMDRFMAGIERFQQHTMHQLVRGLGQAAQGDHEPDPLKPKRRRRASEKRERDDERER
jgi:hypothetical protein